MNSQKKKRSKRLKQQLDFFNIKTELAFGGSSKSHPKKARPLSTKKSHHLVMRSRHAVGTRSFLSRKNSKAIHQIMNKQAKKFGVKFYDLVLASNHFHALLRVQSPRLYRGFIRSISGLIARLIMGTERGPAAASVNEGDVIEAGNATQKPESFWDGRPFTRIVDWGGAFKIAKDYLLKNRLEAIGFAVERRLVSLPSHTLRLI